MSNYIPTVPLPSFYRFFPSSYLKKSLGIVWKISNNRHFLFFSRGSQALASVAQVIYKKNERIVFFFPSYYCNESLTPLRESDAQIVFYQVTHELDPDWNDIRKRSKTMCPDVFVLVHTFGLIRDQSEAISFSKECGCVILEDAAHVLISDGSLGTEGSIVLFSPHKLLALPPISLLSVPDTFNIQNPYETSWRLQDWKWLAKRIIQKGVVAFSGLEIKPKPRPGGFKSNKGRVIEIQHPHKVSKLGRWLLFEEQPHIKNILHLRRKNASFLARAISEISDIEIPNPFSGWFDNEIAMPYAFPFFVPEKFAPKIYLNLWKQGIPVQTWPDLPPEVLANGNEYHEAIQWRNRLLLLPIHQSITPKHLKTMVLGLKFALKHLQ